MKEAARLTGAFFPRLLRWALLAILIPGFDAAGATAEAPKNPSARLDIDIRSSVDDQWDGFRKKAPEAHGKIYGIAAVRLAPSQIKLVKPVDEAGLVRQLRRELGSHGYVEIKPGEKPDVVLTVLYGRGWLRNPYLAGAAVDEDSDIAPVSTIILPAQVFKQREAGFEAKLQRAQFEKLFVMVTAYGFPAGPAEKPRKLWSTKMIVDDPANRDLNQVYEAMLAAGARYFDHPMDREEITVSTDAPEGRVTLGPLEVLELGKPATSPQRSQDK